MKKFLCAILVAICGLSLVFATTACKAEESETTKINVLVPDGAPALTVAKLLKEQPQFEGYDITYTVITGGASDVSAKMVSGEGNMAIIPTNLAAVLYNKIGAKLISTNVQGLLYLVGKNNLSSLEDLKGQVVYNIGQGATPDLTFKYILTAAGIEYETSDTAVPGKVALTYVSSGAELIPLLKQGKANYGILGEPAATKATKAAGVTIQFDIQELWQYATASETYGYPQASLIVNKDLQTEEHKAFLKWFLENISVNDAWLVENPSEARSLLEENGSLVITSDISKDMINGCNIKTVFALDAKASVTAYLNVLFGYNASSVGGKVPAEDFFYEVR